MSVAAHLALGLITGCGVVAWGIAMWRAAVNRRVPRRRIGDDDGGRRVLSSSGSGWSEAREHELLEACEAEFARNDDYTEVLLEEDVGRVLGGGVPVHCRSFPAYAPLGDVSRIDLGADWVERAGYSAGVVAAFETEETPE